MRNRRNTLPQSRVKTTRQAGTRSAGFLFLFFFSTIKTQIKRQTDIYLCCCLYQCINPSYFNDKSKWHTLKPTHGLASTLSMRTTISPWQWQLWTAAITRVIWLCARLRYWPAVGWCSSVSLAFIVVHHITNQVNTCVHDLILIFSVREDFHALKGIMVNQGKFRKKQSCKTNVCLNISVLISIWWRNIYSRRPNPYSRFTSVLESIEWMMWAHELFLRLKPTGLIKSQPLMQQK